MATKLKTSEKQPNLIVGLGNPGKKYTHTRHNVGFMIIEALASRMSANWHEKAAWCAQTAQVSENTIAIKPTTYMNDSGRAVNAVSKYFSIPQNHICVVYDDRDLPYGTIRWTEGFRTGARHNGVRSVAHYVGKSFYRLRFGIGNTTLAHIPLESFVLQSFTEFEKAVLNEQIEKTVDYLIEKFEIK